MRTYLILFAFIYTALIPFGVYSMTWVWDNLLKPGYYELFGGRKCKR